MGDRQLVSGEDSLIDVHMSSSSFTNMSSIYTAGSFESIKLGSRFQLQLTRAKSGTDRECFTPSTAERVIAYLL
jgi:hypothetical protein